MYCIQCGTNLPENSKFCTECGSQILNKNIKTGYNNLVLNNEINFKQWGASHVLSEQETGISVKPDSLFKIFKDRFIEIKDKKNNPEKWAKKDRDELENKKIREVLFKKADLKIVDIIYSGKESKMDERDFREIVNHEKESSGVLVNFFPFVIGYGSEKGSGVFFITSKGIAYVIQSKSSGAILALAGFQAAGAIGAGIGAALGAIKKTKKMSKSAIYLLEKCEKYSVSLVTKCYPRDTMYPKEIRPDGLFLPYQYIDKIIYDFDKGCIRVISKIVDEIFYINKDDLIELIGIFK